MNPLMPPEAVAKLDQNMAQYDEALTETIRRFRLLASQVGTGAATSMFALQVNQTPIGELPKLLGALVAAVVRCAEREPQEPQEPDA